MEKNSGWLKCLNGNHLNRGDTLSFPSFALLPVGMARFRNRIVTFMVRD